MDRRAVVGVAVLVMTVMVATASATAAPVPEAATNVTAYGAEDSIWISWGLTEVVKSIEVWRCIYPDGYYLQQATLAGDTTQYRDETAKAGTDYMYFVRTCNGRRHYANSLIDTAALGSGNSLYAPIYVSATVTGWWYDHWAIELKATMVCTEATHYGCWRRIERKPWEFRGYVAVTNTHKLYPCRLQFSDSLYCEQGTEVVYVIRPVILGPESYAEASWRLW